MTTIRQYVEEDNITEYVRKWFHDHKGHTPLCCFETRRVDNGFYMRCEWLKEQDTVKEGWLPETEFYKACLECQKDIQKKMKEAIILAAGLSLERCGFPPDSKPKCLFHVKNEVLLEKQVKILNELGISRIQVVVGYRKEDIIAFCRAQNLDVIITENPGYDKDSLASLTIPLKNVIDDEVLILAGDWIANRKGIETLLYDPKDVVVYTCSSDCYVFKVPRRLFERVPELDYEDHIKEMRKKWTEEKKNPQAFEQGGYRIIVGLNHWLRIRNNAKVYNTKKEDVDYYKETDEGKI